jgi:hypothetical protein
MVEIEKIIDEMAERWSSNIVARKKVSEFTGGSVSNKTMQNEDWKKTGPQGRFLLLNQVCYPKENLVIWLKDRIAKSWQTRKTV